MRFNVIEYCGRHFTFENLRDEPAEVFMKRTWFIVKNYEKYEGRYERLVNMSYLWINVRELGVEYDNAIMKELAECESIWAQKLSSN